MQTPLRSGCPHFHINRIRIVEFRRFQHTAQRVGQGRNGADLLNHFLQLALRELQARQRGGSEGIGAGKVLREAKVFGIGFEKIFRGVRNASRHSLERGVALRFTQRGQRS